MLKVETVLEELEKNHNWSIYDEIYDRNKNGLERTALFYRGTNITYGEMFDKMNEYAKSLVANGVQPGNEIPVCMSNTPELVYLIGAASIVGAKLNIFGEEFDKEYITEIINDCNSPVIFVGDNKYEEIKESIENSKINNIVMTSLKDSFKNGVDLYEKIDNFQNNIEIYKKENSNIKSMDEFIVKDYAGEYKHNSKLDDEFIVTYSSGSTNSSRPKAIVHSHRSYVTMGTFHDPKVSGTPSMKNLRVLAQIPSHSNTNIMSCITDSLVQGSTVCLEPVYDKDFFMTSLLINKPDFPCATKSFWVYLSKKVMKLKEEGKNIKFPFLLAPMSVGEPLSKGEEKFCNKMLKMTKAGTSHSHTPSSVVSMCVAGGDCEHGGIFFIMFRSLMAKVKGIPKDEYDILRTYSMVDIIAVDENGNVLEKGQTGRLYAASPCNMSRYKNNDEANKKFFKEHNGKIYGDCSVYGYIGAKDYIHVKGRMSEFSKIPPYQIADEILKDTKNILSCEVIEQENEDYGKVYVAHVEFQPNMRNSDAVALMSAIHRCKLKFTKQISDKIIFRVRSFNESFPLTGCGKRNGIKLTEEGISEQCIRPVRTHKHPEPFFVSGTDYLYRKQDNEKKLTYSLEK